MSFPHDWHDVEALTDKKAMDYLMNLVDGILQFGKDNPKLALENMLFAMDSGEDDCWGTEGWRHSILGED